MNKQKHGSNTQYAHKNGRGKSNPKKIVCYHCGEEGHKSNECPKKKNKEKAHVAVESCNEYIGMAQEVTDKSSEEMIHMGSRSSSEVSSDTSNRLQEENTLRRHMRSEDIDMDALEDIRLQSSESNEPDDSDNDENEVAYMAQIGDTSEENKGDPSDIRNWGVDSGATSHFTPYLSDLIDPEECNIGVTIADSSEVTGTHKGTVLLKVKTNKGKVCNLKLTRVIYVPGLNRRLFSVMAFCKNKSYAVNFNYEGGFLDFGDGHSISTSYDAFRNHHAQIIHQAHEDNSINDVADGSDDGSSEGGESQIDTTQNQNNEIRNKRTQKDMDQWLSRLGYAPLRDLLMGSQHGVWSDTFFRMTNGTFNTGYKISIIPKTKMSKVPFPKAKVPFQRIFVDIIPGVKDQLYTDKHCSCYLIIVDQYSRWISLEQMNNYSTEETINAIQKWCKGERGLTKLELIEYIRSDAGTQFTSEKFRKFCELHGIECELAAPEHQEMNSMCEANYKRVKQMGRRLLVNASLSHHFMYLAYMYTIAILNVMPTRGLRKDHNKVTTPFELVRGYKPSLAKYHTFGCPVVFKRGNLTIKIKGPTAGLQLGAKGIFVGFPLNQAGYLIYVDKPIQGHGHFTVSKDVAFDDNMDSALVANRHVFKGGLNVRSIGRGLIEPIEEREVQQTGDISQLVDTQDIQDVFDEAERQTNEVKASSAEELADMNPFNFEPHEYEEIKLPDDFWMQPQHDTDGYDEDMPATYKGQILNDEIEDTKDQATDYVALMSDVDSSEIEVTEATSNRRSRRTRLRTKRYGQEEIKLIMHIENKNHSQRNQIFTTLEKIAADNEDNIDQYLPEPRNIKEFRKLSKPIQQRWLAAIKKEVLNLVNNDTFKAGTIQEGERPIPTMVVFKAKVTSKGTLDKLKVRIVARGDMMAKEEEDTWSGCVAARTVKVFLANAAKYRRPVKQMDFIGAFLQALARGRLWIQLPPEYAYFFPELSKYFERPQLLHKTIYGLIYASKYWNEDLTEFLKNDLGFEASLYDPSLLIKRYENGDFIKLIIHTDDALYFGSTDRVEKEFIEALAHRFNLEDQGYTHWYLSHRIYREKDGSFIMDQEQYTRHLLKKFFPENAPWGSPTHRDTPAPLDYVFSKDDRPDEKEQVLIKKKYPGLKLSSIVCSLLYLALSTRPDILWVVGKMSKGCSNPSLKDYRAAFWTLGYLRNYTSYGIRLYANYEDSPVYKACIENNIQPKELVGMTDSSFQDCPDTGRSTTGYKVFYRGSMCEANSSVPVPVAMSSAEAEYMGASNAATTLAHFR